MCTNLKHFHDLLSTLRDIEWEWYKYCKNHQLLYKNVAAVCDGVKIAKNLRNKSALMYMIRMDCAFTFNARWNNYFFFKCNCIEIAIEIEREWRFQYVTRTVCECPVLSNLNKVASTYNRMCWFRWFIFRWFSSHINRTIKII